jgi:glycosyltransferase involved in cell wall biosynthesis
VHVIPTAVARGAQLYARALADELDTPAERHLVLCLFDHVTDVEVDERLGVRASRSAGEGYDPRVGARFRWRIRQMSPAAVVAHGGDAFKYALWAGGGCHVVYLAIGTLAAPARRGLRRQLWRAMARRADMVAAVSEDVAAECRSALGVDGHRLVVIPNGRDPARFHPAPNGGPSDAPPTVLFVGRMVPGKRPERFVSLVAELRARGLELRALAVGDGPLRPGIEEAARNAGVELPGGSREVAEIMRGADLLVFPSTPEGEGMPGVLIEAGLSGLPVVATAVAGVTDVVADGVTGVVVPVGDFGALVDAAAALVVDPERRLSMGAAARARCNELFTMRASASRWRELLSRLAPTR